MRVEGARIVAIALSALGHGALIAWLGAGIGEAIQPPEPITVALVVEAWPAAAAAPPATASPAAADPAPPTEARAAPPIEPVPPAEARAAAPTVSTPTPQPIPAPQLVPAPLAKPAPAAIDPAPSAPEQLALVAPAAGGGASSAPAAESAAPSGNAVAALSPREATPLAGGGNAPPVYPMAARRQGIQGRVVLEVAVDVAGRATEVNIARSSSSRLLDDAALEAVRDWRFTPATVGGVPLASKVQVPVTFRLDAPG